MEVSGFLKEKIIEEFLKINSSFRKEHMRKISYKNDNYILQLVPSKITYNLLDAFSSMFRTSDIDVDNWEYLPESNEGIMEIKIESMMSPKEVVDFNNWKI